MPRKTGSPSLEVYRAKRSAGRTPEPFGGGEAAGTAARLFVVQKHAARALHWDLRLEIDGVLRSWAVPKGPSFDPADKRLAVETEDHPLEYANFEGIIPAGNYGAGAMIVWDRGTWRPLEAVEEGLARGKLLFELRGQKLRGVWTLFRTKQGPKHWMLMKEREPGLSGPTALPEESILSGLTVEELGNGNPRAAAIRADLERWGAPRCPVGASDADPMLAETADGPFSREGWVFELKYDGYRMMAIRDGPEPLLLYRRGSEATGMFPEIARALRALPWTRLVADGEVVVLDEEARPSFQRLQQRLHLTRPRDVRHASEELPATLYLFDLLGFEDYDLRPLQLVQRKAVLRRLLPAHGGPLRFAEHVEETGSELFEEVRKAGLEGLMAKRAAAPYRAGRSRDWLKVPSDRTADFVVVGFSDPKGSRGGVGALHVALRDGERLVYAGSVGTGFREDERVALRARLEPSRVERAPCDGRTPGKGVTWVQPALACEVRYKEWTDERLLRHPVFLGFPGDEPAEEKRVAPAPPPPSIRADGLGEAAAPEVPFTRLDKIFWPDEELTKGHLVEYYRSVSPWLLPYLKDRPVVLTRYPDGIAGKHFFQKDAPKFAPSWIRTVRMWSENAEREIDYFVCDELESLLYLANLASIPLHVWSSRVATLEHPDWCILDLDPKGAPFRHVVEVALAIRGLCDAVELPCFVKTSGSSGLHVLLPMGRRCTFEQSRAFGEALARMVAEALPEIATVERAIRARGGRVYVDALQNGHGKLLVAPFSVRPLPGAPVSAPLRWSEVNGRLEIGKFTMRNVTARLRRMGTDPLRGVLDTDPDLPLVLERLAELAGEPHANWAHGRSSRPRRKS